MWLLLLVLLLLWVTKAVPGLLAAALLLTGVASQRVLRGQRGDGPTRAGAAARPKQTKRSPRWST